MLAEDNELCFWLFRGFWHDFVGEQVFFARASEVYQD